jgi:hypothetical protein
MPAVRFEDKVEVKLTPRPVDRRSANFEVGRLSAMLRERLDSRMAEVRVDDNPDSMDAKPLDSEDETRLETLDKRTSLDIEGVAAAS